MIMMFSTTVLKNTQQKDILDNAIQHRHSITQTNNTEFMHTQQKDIEDNDVKHVDNPYNDTQNTQNNNVQYHSIQYNGLNRDAQPKDP